MYTTYSSEQAPLFTCKAHIFQVNPDTRKSWLPLSIGAGMKSKKKLFLILLFYIVNVQIFHDSVKNVYRILSVDGSKVLINTIVTARMTFTKTSQKFCQWIDSKANHVYGLGFTNEIDLTRVDLFNKKLIFSNLFNNFLVYG
jgi:homer protein